MGDDDHFANKLMTPAHRLVYSKGAMCFLRSHWDAKDAKGAKRMRHEVKQSLRKALAILLIIGSLFAFAQGKWPIGVGVLVVAFLALGDDSASRKPPREPREDY